MTNQADIFKGDPTIETLIHVPEIANDATELKLEIYTRNKRNAGKALTALKIAIDELCNSWETDPGKYLSFGPLVPTGTEQPTYLRYVLKDCPLNIARSGKG